MLNLFTTKPPQDLETIAQIKQWIREIMNVSEETIITVAELNCLEDDCPDVETVIGVMGEPGQARKHKLLMPIRLISREDIVALAARGTHG